MVLTLKAKDGLEHDNPYPGRPDRPDRQPGGAARRFDGGGPPADGRHRLPLPRLVPDGQDRRSRSTCAAEHIGRRDRRRRRPGRRLRPTLRRPARTDRGQDGPLGAPRRPAGPTYDASGASGRPARPTPDYDDELVGQVRGRCSTTPTELIRPGGAGRGDRPARRRRRDLHHRHRNVDGLALALRDDARNPAAARLLQPRLDGQRDAPGARRAGARPRPAGDRVLRRRRPDDAARRPDHRGRLRPAGEAGRLRQRPARHGQARTGAGRAAGVRHGARTTPTSPRSPGRWA